MMGTFEADNCLDLNGNPTGGWVKGEGLAINWQNGPLGRDKDRVAPNGAFTETVIAAVIQRLEYFQKSKFACVENQNAIAHLQLALDHLDSRTKKREAQKVEGTHAVHA